MLTLTAGRSFYFPFLYGAFVSNMLLVQRQALYVLFNLLKCQTRIRIFVFITFVKSSDGRERRREFNIQIVRLNSTLLHDCLHVKKENPSYIYAMNLK